MTLPAHHNPLIAEIQRSVADHFGISLNDLTCARRAREVARPRQLAMFLCKGLTGSSLPAIGSRFGGRDHTTVMHAVRTIERLYRDDYEVRSDIKACAVRAAAAAAARVRDDAPVYEDMAA